MSTAVSAAGEPPRLVVVVAHPDDETFGTGSVLLHAAATGAATTVICATRGEAGEVTPGSGVDPANLATVREAELRRAATQLGVTRVEVLGFGDSDMSGPAGPATLVGADPADVRDAVRAVLLDVRPDVVVTLDAGDGHRDHAAIRDATLAAVDAAGLAFTRVYLHCLPSSLMDRWVAHMASSDPSWQHLELGALGTPDEQVTTEIDTRGHLADRVAAMAEHRSQRSPYEGLPQELFEAFLTREHLIRVRPNWPGGPREADLLDQVTART